MKHLEEEKREVYDIYTVFLFVIYFKEEKNHMKILRTSLFVCCVWPSLHRCKIKKKQNPPRVGKSSVTGDASYHLSQRVFRYMTFL